MTYRRCLLSRMMLVAMVALCLPPMGCKGRSSSSTGKPAAAELPRLAGPGYSLPIHPKFTEERGLAKQAAKQGGKALLAIGRKQVPNALRGSIAVIPIANRGQDMSKFDGTRLGCTEPLAAMKNIHGFVRMIELPAGRFCQIAGTVRDHQTRGVKYTLFKQKGVNRAWGVTCNYDTRDDTAKEACDTALQGWRFER